jgi:hypothetical protein
VVGHEHPLAFGESSVAFGAQLVGDAFNAAGIFRIYLAAGFERSPKRRDAFCAFRFRFGGGVRGDPRKNSRRQRAGEVRSVFFGERGAEFVDGDDASARHLFHQSVHLARRGDDEPARAPTFGQFTGDFADFWQAFVIHQFFAPVFFRFHNCYFHLDCADMSAL